MNVRHIALHREDDADAQVYVRPHYTANMAVDEQQYVNRNMARLALQELSVDMTRHMTGDRFTLVQIPAVQTLRDACQATFVEIL